MNNITKKLRKMALELSYKCNDGNLQSVFSCIDIIWVLYDKVMNWSPQMALDNDRDFFIISKGQATLGLYPVLIEKGMFSYDMIINEIGKFESRYCIQTDITKFAEGGIENNAGSLGHGLPFATGIAYANKIKNIDSMVYVLCGDGEFCEGTMWESLIFAQSKNLDNLCIIVDDNDSVSDMVNLDSLNEKFISFGFDVLEVDGHDVNTIETSLLSLKTLKNRKPKVLIAHTIRGFGSKTMMEDNIWFHKSPNADELKKLTKEVDLF